MKTLPLSFGQKISLRSACKFATAALSLSLFIATPVLAATTRVAVAGAPQDNSSRIAELEIQIFQIAQANTLRTDNLAAVHAQLQPLVDELVKLAPARTETEKLPEVVGAWQNIWNDLDARPSTDLAQIYQVVFADGYYYNISREHFAIGDLTSFLRGAFADNTQYLDIQFTRQFTIPGWLPAGTSLVKLGSQAESGLLNGTDDFNSRALGVTGRLYNSYVSGDFRIVQGSSSDSPDRSRLFVLTRVATVQ